MFGRYCIMNIKLGHQYTYEYASNIDKSRYYILSSTNCTLTHLCPEMLVPRHVCALTDLCPDTIVPRHDCAQT